MRKSHDYLRTGYEASWQRVFAGWARTQAVWGNADFAQKVRRIRQLNQPLPRPRRIAFVGIDGVQNPALVADYLAELRASRTPLPLPLAAVLDSVQATLRQPTSAAVLAFFDRLPEFGQDLASPLTRKFHILDAQLTS